LAKTQLISGFFDRKILNRFRIKSICDVYEAAIIGGFASTMMALAAFWRAHATTLAFAENLDREHPDAPKILRTLAAAYTKTGDFTETIVTAKRALAQTQCRPSLVSQLQGEIIAIFACTAQTGVLESASPNVKNSCSNPEIRVPEAAT
jgi:hypothetical protein